MKKSLGLLLCGALLWHFSIGSAYAVEGGQVVELASDPWPPYILGDLGFESSGGIGIELLQEIFARLDGVTLSTPLVPWNRALREVARGTKDGIGIILKTPEREEYMEYSEELFRSYNVAWYLDEAFPEGFTWQSHDDFLKYDVGVIRGSSYGEEIDRFLKFGFLKGTQVSSVDQLFAMLRRGRINVAIADQLVGEAYVQKFHDANNPILKADKPLGIEVYYIAFSKLTSAKLLLPELNDVIRELRREGVIEKLIGEAQKDYEILMPPTLPPAEAAR